MTGVAFGEINFKTARRIERFRRFGGGAVTLSSSPGCLPGFGLRQRGQLASVLWDSQQTLLSKRGSITSLVRVKEENQESGPPLTLSDTTDTDTIGSYSHYEGKNNNNYGGFSIP